MVKKVEYSRSINQCNLIITAEEESKVEKDSIEMFRHNKIPYFLQFNTQKKDNAVQFFYDITGMQPLEQALEYQSLNYRFVKKLLESFDQACIQAANYMLTENDIALLPELLYLNTESDEVLYCYLPGNQIHICVQFKRFMEYLMRHLDHKDKRAVQLVYGVYQQVAEEKNALHSVLNNAENGWKQIINSSGNSEQIEQPMQQQEIYAQTDIGQQKYIEKKDFKQRNEKQRDIEQKNMKKEGQKQRKNKKTIFNKSNIPEQNRKDTKKQGAKRITNFFRKKIYTDSYQKMEDETFFEEEPEKQIKSPVAAYEVPNTDALQNRFIYQGPERNRDFACPQGKKVLGSSEKYVDICIPFPMVSKIHARIEANEKGTFLEDMNSANGTQVNGETLKYREKRILQKGDIISIAGESYRFC